MEDQINQDFQSLAEFIDSAQMELKVPLQVSTNAVNAAERLRHAALVDGRSDEEADSKLAEAVKEIENLQATVDELRLQVKKAESGGGGKTGRSPKKPVTAPPKNEAEE